MPPKPRLRPGSLRPTAPKPQYVCWQCQRASMTTTTTPAAAIERGVAPAAPIQHYPPTQPPSYKPPQFRKSQLHRQYQSILRSTPLMVLFQHSNLKAMEWTGIRRELAIALKKVDDEMVANGNLDMVGEGTKMQIVQTGIFESALKVVEFWNPDFTSASASHPTDPKTSSSTPVAETGLESRDSAFTHGLSRTAWEVARKERERKTGLEPLLSGPLALLTFPSVSPQHLKAALQILSPSKEFPAPKRRVNPAYHEPAVQNGLQKLMLLGARVEGKVFDLEGTRWVGGIPGGIEGLRAQLVVMLQSAGGATIANTLEAAGKSLYVTVEGRRGMMEDEQKGKDGGA